MAEEGPPPLTPPSPSFVESGVGSRSSAAAPSVARSPGRGRTAALRRLKVAAIWQKPYGLYKSSNSRRQLAPERCEQRLQRCNLFRLHTPVAYALLCLTAAAGAVPLSLTLRSSGRLFPPHAAWCPWEDAPRVKHVSNEQWQWRVMAMHFTLLFTGAVTAGLLLRGASRHLQLVARYTVSIWLSSILYVAQNYCECHGLQQTGLHFHSLATMAHWISWPWLLVILCDRISGLQRRMLQELRAWRLRLLTRLGCLQIVASLVNTWFVRSGPLEATFAWTTVLLLAVFMLQTIACFRRALRAVFSAQRNAEGRTKRELHKAASLLRMQIVGVCASLSTTLACLFCAIVYKSWLPGVQVQWGHDGTIWLNNVPWILDRFGNILGALLFSGALTGALKGSRAKLEREVRRQRKRHEVTRGYSPCPDQRWQAKVEELATRGFTMASLLRFYRGLGSAYMTHFDSARHTTGDVVRQAIIPLSRESKTAYATVMMNGEPLRPEKMVTHNWGNLFRDLVAAIVADALGEEEFCRVGYALDHEIDLLEEWLEAADKLGMSYWVCAFSISQHDGICGSNPYGDRDSVTGQLHPVCTCGKPKVFNTDPPLTDDGKSVACEMNKFDDMMRYLACSDSYFSQVIAVDSQFELFSRAWCVAELAAANAMGMKQSLKIMSADVLERREGSLAHLKVQDMKASRPEDIDEILAKIPDKEEFNTSLHHLIFNGLIAGWRHMDVEERLERSGCLARWQVVSDLHEGTIWKENVPSDSRTASLASSDSVAAPPHQVVTVDDSLLAKPHTPESVAPVLKANARELVSL